MKKLNSGYVMSVVSAILLLLEVIGVKVDIPYVNEIVMATLGVLVALGIATGKGDKGDKNDIFVDEEPESEDDKSEIDDGNEMR